MFLLAGSLSAQTEAVTRDPAGFLIARPSQPNGVLFMLYPGGLVPAPAYSFIAAALARQGVTTVIPEMPLNLAFFDFNHGERILQTLQSRGERFRKVVYGGHSLGGAMAGLVAGWGGKVDGLVMLAAYPGANCRALNVPALSIAAEFDGLLGVERVRTSLSQMPADTKLEVIPGGVHAFFGRYGPQNGDGTPTTTREQFEARLLEVLGVFFKRF